MKSLSKIFDVANLLTVFESNPLNRTKIIS